MDKEETEGNMKNMPIILLLALVIGCGDDENVNCTMDVECSDEKEMLCDQPVMTRFEDGTMLEVRACTYITYEYCFEKTECRPEGLE